MRLVRHIRGGRFRVFSWKSPHHPEYFWPAETKSWLSDCVSDGLATPRDGMSKLVINHSCSRVVVLKWWWEKKVMQNCITWPGPKEWILLATFNRSCSKALIASERLSLFKDFIPSLDQRMSSRPWLAAFLPNSRRKRSCRSHLTFFKLVSKYGSCTVSAQLVQTHPRVIKHTLALNTRMHDQRVKVVAPYLSALERNTKRSVTFIGCLRPKSWHLGQPTDLRMSENFKLSLCGSLFKEFLLALV